MQIKIHIDNEEQVSKVLVNYYFWFTVNLLYYHAVS